MTDFKVSDGLLFSHKDDAGRPYHGIEVTIHNYRYYRTDDPRNNFRLPHYMGQVCLFVENDKTVTTKSDAPLNHVHVIGDIEPLLEDGRIPVSLYDKAVCNIAEYQRESWAKRPLWNLFYTEDNIFMDTPLYERVLIHKGNLPDNRLIYVHNEKTFALTVSLNNYGDAPIGPVAGFVKVVVEHYPWNTSLTDPKVWGKYRGIVSLQVSDPDNMTNDIPGVSREIICSNALINSLRSQDVPVEIYDEAVCAIARFREAHWRSLEHGPVN